MDSRTHPSRVQERIHRWFFLEEQGPSPAAFLRAAELGDVSRLRRQLAEAGKDPGVRYETRLSSLHLGEISDVP